MGRNSSLRRMHPSTRPGTGRSSSNTSGWRSRSTTASARCPGPSPIACRRSMTDSPKSRWMPVTWTQGEDNDNRYWFTSYDYPNQRFTSEILATVDEQYEALSNGRLVNVSADKRRKTKTYHWSLDRPHSNYLIALAVGEFESKEWNADGVPVHAHVPKGLGSYLDRTFKNVPDMVRYFSEATGQKYPWPRYAQVCVPEFVVGGMENTSMTTLTDYCLTDEKAHDDYRPEGLLSHELAHQWFGDFLTC